MRTFSGLASCLIFVLPLAARAQVLSERTTPRLALSHLVEALMDDDTVEIRKWTSPISADDKDVVRVFQDRARVKHLLNSLATAKFGPAGARAVVLARYPGNVGDIVDRALQAATAAGEFTEEGDTGTLLAKPKEGDLSAAEPIYFQRVKGDWKVDLPRLLGMQKDGLAGAARKESNGKLLEIRAETVALAQFVERIRANDFPTAITLQEAIEQALNKSRQLNVY